MPKFGLIIAFFAIFLQIAVFLQPLLPHHFQDELVCETVSKLNTHHSMMGHTKKKKIEHECLYCYVYGHVVAHLDLSIKETFYRLQIRLLAFKKEFKYIYFVLHRLFLMPQGRAPPSFS